VALRPDLGIDQWPSAAAPRVLLIPGGQQCAAAIATDPRAYRLMENTAALGGIVAVAYTAHATLMSAGLPIPVWDVSWLFQGEATNAEFAARLVGCF
jgi:hypothetical protein